MDEASSLIKMAENKVVGLKQVLHNLVLNNCEFVVLAKDVSQEFKKIVCDSAEKFNTQVVFATSKEMLAKACSIEVPTGVCAVLKNQIERKKR